jgi:hypothetical protein
MSGWPHLDLVTILIFLSEQNVIDNIRIWTGLNHESSRKLSQISRKKKDEVIWTSRTWDMGWTLNNVGVAGQIRTSLLLLQFGLGNGLFESCITMKGLGLCLSFPSIYSRPKSKIYSFRYDPMTEQCYSLDWTNISFLSLTLSLSFQFQYLNSSINPFIYVIGLHLRWAFATS